MKERGRERKATTTKQGIIKMRAVDAAWTRRVGKSCQRSRTSSQNKRGKGVEGAWPTRDCCLKTAQNGAHISKPLSGMPDLFRPCGHATEPEESEPGKRKKSVRQSRDSILGFSWPSDAQTIKNNRRRINLATINSHLS